MPRGLLEATGNVAGQSLATGGTDFPGAETRLPRSGQRHAKEIRSPAGSGLRKGENSGSRHRNAAVSVSWGPPCLPGATPSHLLCLVASLLLVCPSSPSSVYIPTPFFLLILLSPVSEKISASSQPTASCVESLCLFGAHFLSIQDW